MSGLPTGWAVCQLSDIGQIVTGKTPSTKESRFYGGDIPFIKPGDLDFASPIFKTETYLTADGAAEVPSLPSQSIVVTCIGNLGKVGLTTTTSATNQQVNAVIPDEGIDPTFLFHYCKTLKPWLEAKSSATTISIVNKGIFSTAPTSLPPLAEQTRIAAKLDELLAQVDTLKARIDSIPALLKRFCQSVLAAAVSGRLTEEWRQGDNPSRDIKKIGAAGVEVKTGPFGSALHKSDYVHGGIPVINPMHISEGIITPSTSMTISNQKYASLSAWHLRKGDVVIGRRGEMGRAAVVEDHEPQLCGTGSMILRVGANSLPKYLEIVLRSPTAVNYFNSASVGSTMINLNQNVIKNFEVYFPALEEQTEIVRRVEQLFAFADQLEARVKTAQARIDRLTQSILAKAFRGELVPQDPNDEPASVLLERIKAQRAAAPKAKRGRKASA